MRWKTPAALLVASCCGCVPVVSPGLRAELAGGGQLGASGALGQATVRAGVHAGSSQRIEDLPVDLGLGYAGGWYTGYLSAHGAYADASWRTRLQGNAVLHLGGVVQVQSVTGGGQSWALLSPSARASVEWLTFRKGGGDDAPGGLQGNLGYGLFVEAGPRFGRPGGTDWYAGAGVSGRLPAFWYLVAVDP